MYDPPIHCPWKSAVNGYNLYCDHSCVWYLSKTCGANLIIKELHNSSLTCFPQLEEDEEQRKENVRVIVEAIRRQLGRAKQGASK